VVVSFVVENSQRVKVRLWFVTGHPRLIWVLVAAVVIGVVLGYVLGRVGRRGKGRSGAVQRRSRRQGDELGRDEGR